MIYLKKWWVVLVLFTICISINVYSSQPVRVEHYYSTQFYPALGSFIRSVFGWLPFSFGDIIYAALLLWVLFKTVQLFRFIALKSKRVLVKQNITSTLIKLVKLFAITYIIFNLFWGINYNRLGIAHQLQLNMQPYSLTELIELNETLTNKINTCKISLLSTQKAYPQNDTLYLKVANAYKKVANLYPFLQYKPIALKTSLWGWFGNYAGFTGYYNPFTGEAQVNTTVPKYTQPFTACHEVAHQLGYAKEMEANFVGYLAASYSTDTLILYSTYTALFSYANRTLYFADTAAALQYRRQLLPAVIADFKATQKFNAAHKSFIEPIVAFAYSKFLQSNQQPLGLLSYDEVTAFLIAYYKKFGKM